MVTYACSTTHSSQTKWHYLYQVADSKLKAAYSHYKYTGQKTYKGAVKFNVPHDEYDVKLLSSSTGKLCRLQPTAAMPPDDGWDDLQLLRMKKVTPTGQDMKFRVTHYALL